MANMASLVQECPICLDSFRDPVVTPCGKPPRRQARRVINYKNHVFVELHTGHLSCGACMGTHVRASRGPYEATCPTCRAPFPVGAFALAHTPIFLRLNNCWMIPVTPDMTLIPKKYHVFISPSLRRVYLGEDSNRAIIDGLNTEITLLKARVGTLKRDKDLLMDRCEAAQSAVARLTSDERATRLELIEARHEARLANLRVESLQAMYNSLEST